MSGLGPGVGSRAAERIDGLLCPSEQVGLGGGRGRWGLAPTRPKATGLRGRWTWPRERPFSVLPAQP